MPSRTAKAVPGTRAAKVLLVQLQHRCEGSIAACGEIDVPALAVILERALADDYLRPGILLALAEVVGMAVTGAPTDPMLWTPIRTPGADV